MWGAASGAASSRLHRLPGLRPLPLVRCPGHGAGTVDAAGLAQLVEQLPCKHQVVSSSLTAGTNPCMPIRARSTSSCQVFRRNVNGLPPQLPVTATKLSPRQCRRKRSVGPCWPDPSGSIPAIEGSLPIASERPEPEVLAGLVAELVAIVAPAALGGCDVNPARGSMDGAGVARGLDEGLDEHERGAVARGPAHGVPWIDDPSSSTIVRSLRQSSLLSIDRRLLQVEDGPNG